MVRADGARDDHASIESEQTHAIETVLERVDPTALPPRPEGRGFRAGEW
jgi:hypothetical protein